MLVVDRVELAMVDHRLDGRVLDGDDAVLGEQRGETGDEVVEIGDVRHHVVGHHGVGGTTLVEDPFGQRAPEEAGDRVDPDRPGGLGRTGCGIHAEGGNARGHRGAQQVAVVARDLDDEAVVVETERGDQALDMATGVVEEGVRHGRVVGVVVGEQGDVVEDLDESAIGAEHDFEREEALRRHIVEVVEQRIGDRRRPEIDHGIESGAVTGTAGRTSLRRVHPVLPRSLRSDHRSAAGRPT